MWVLQLPVHFLFLIVRNKFCILFSEILHVPDLSHFHFRKKCWQIGFCWQIGVWQIGGCNVFKLPFITDATIGSGQTPLAGLNPNPVDGWRRRVIWIVDRTCWSGNPLEFSVWLDSVILWSIRFAVSCGAGGSKTSLSDSDWRSKTSRWSRNGDSRSLSDSP